MQREVFVAETATSARIDPRRRYGALLTGLAVLVFAGDQLTKWMAVRSLTDGAEHTGPVTWHIVENTGIAFGLFGEHPHLVAIGSIIVAVALVVVIGKAFALRAAAGAAAGLVVGGAVGNLTDRLRLGHVVDFVDLGFWPAFNLADVAIVAGICTLILVPNRSRHHADRD